MQTPELRQTGTRMTSRTALVAGVLLFVAVAAVAMTQRGDHGNAAKKAEKTPAASVSKPVKEDELGAVRLSEQAAASLAVRTAPIERAAIEATRVYGGEITIPAG